MNWFCKGLFLFVLVLFIAGCGSGGTTGTGNTVAVTAGITNGTAGSVFAHMSSAISSSGTITHTFISNDMSITLTSVAINKTGTVPVSNVNVKAISMSLTPLPYSSTPINTANILSPTITNPQYANNPQGVGGIIPGPGSLKIDGIPILGLSDFVFLEDAFNQSSLFSVQYHYTANLTFHLEEANTGTQFTVSNPVGVEVSF